MPSPTVTSTRSSKLDNRLDALVDPAKRALAVGAGGDAHQALLNELTELPVIVVEECAGRPDRSSQAAEVMGVAGTMQRALRDAVLDAHSQVFARINEVFASAARCASPAELVQSAPALLCQACDFDRAMISGVRGSMWVPTAIHVAIGADDEVNISFAETAMNLEIPLTTSLVETDVLRRRASMLVDGSIVERHPSHVLAGLSRSRSYVVAPIVIAERVAGYLHADTYTSERLLCDSDRVALQAFADMYGLLYERAVMIERLSSQQEAIRSALTRAAESVTDMGTDVARLARTEFTTTDLGMREGSARASERLESGSLTVREWEILGHLATGATNGQIAAALVVSESTVKSHVKRILRKLPAANRAEAVYRYTQMTANRTCAS
jgi:DNA-binding CsgD family transcriptional regulator